jgi:hypothetical protein
LAEPARIVIFRLQPCDTQVAMAHRASVLIWYTGRAPGTGKQTGVSAMPIDWATIPWTPLGLLAALTFVSSFIGLSVTKNALVGAIIAVVIFVAVYVFWDFYPHNLLPNVRFPTRI